MMKQKQLTSAYPSEVWLWNFKEPATEGHMQTEYSSD
jgi:hypothetical protein